VHDSEQGVPFISNVVECFSPSLLQDGRSVMKQEKERVGARAHSELKGEKVSVRARASLVVLQRAALCQTP
jgi:hypothetical protein